MMSWRLCLAALASCLLAASPPVEILSGVVANEVIQQDGAGTGTITLRARCVADQCLGVEARVLDSHGTLRGSAQTAIAITSGV